MGEPSFNPWLAKGVSVASIRGADSATELFRHARKIKSVPVGSGVSWVLLGRLSDVCGALKRELAELLYDVRARAKLEER